MAGGGGGGGGTSTRTPSWKERENNRRRERRRRAISAKIFTGLRTYGNYSLPKHCDNNEVLKALCFEAGWTVEPDGTTYRKGQKPPPHLDTVPRPASPSPHASFNPTPVSASPSSSYHPSPYASFNPSPVSSSLASPASSSYGPTTNYLDGGSLIPWLKTLSSASSSASFHGGRSISAPVTPPFSSPGHRQTDWWGGGANSPTFSLVSAQMLTPLQSGTCSPAAQTGDVPMMTDVLMSDEFAFRSGAHGGVVKAWEGERIHDDCSDDLELTLGCSKTR
ncbi:hypothetical protein RND81_12G237700 [Saponaria officinalis]|uniref:Protein BZR1 homolog n=1 Tax=Saponaria officinalis TaxID=3572 RepID=A0AAW1HEH4_SAPOF